MAKNVNNTNKTFFTATLLHWNKVENQRVMPWKNEKDPYKVWISEIILQQTRVQQGIQYYKKFIKAFPDVQHITNASESQIFKLWEGLGYYNRCKNIIASARYITNELNGKFPEKFNDILQLRGIGNYTASAIASFAYNLPYAVLDGNVFRVLSRFFGIAVPIDNNDGKKIYSIVADQLLDKKNPANYNQAIMDFGATICKPKSPLCNICPLQQKCFAFMNQTVDSLPVKEKFITRKYRWLYYLLIEWDNKLYVRKRITKDIWQNLNEFVLIETPKPVSVNSLQDSIVFKQIFNSEGFIVTSISKIYRQQLTHQTITGRFLRINLKTKLNIQGYEIIPINQLNLLPFPKFITTYLKD
ncbi:MAG: A/G-specific adenine glycosylase [Ginsengibacter sp.]